MNVFSVVLQSHCLMFLFVIFLTSYGIVLILTSQAFIIFFNYIFSLKLPYDL